MYDSVLGFVYYVFLTMRYQGPSTWNNLPSDIKLVDSTAAFKKLYRQYLINKY